MRAASPATSRLALLAVHALLIACAVVMLVPFAFMFTTALKTTDPYGSMFLPSGDGFLGVAWEQLSFANFHRLFAEVDVVRAVLNSVFLSSLTSLGATLCAAMGGYALSKYQFRGREPLTQLTLGALIIPATLLLAPGYQLLYHLGLLDTYAGMLLPAMAPAFGVFLFRQAMLNSVPADLIEAARIDGAGELRIFFSLVVPLVRPMIGAFLMITFLQTWNNFINPQVVLQSPELFPLSVAINNLRGVYSTEIGMISAGTFVSIAPVLCLFLLLQKEFISGLTSGAVKG